jgi:phosphate-selective porin OprO and OprP
MRGLRRKAGALPVLLILLPGVWPIAGSMPAAAEDRLQDGVAADPDIARRRRAIEERLDQLQRRFEAIQEQPVQPPPRPDAIERDMQQMESRARFIESLTLGTWQTRGLSERGAGWSPQSGFFLRSSDGEHFLRITGFAQVDYRAFPGGQSGADPGTNPDTFNLRRMRPVLDGRLFRQFHFQIGIDFSGRGRSELLNAFIDWEYFNTLRVRVGQFKVNVNPEITQGGVDLVFMERSLVQNLNPYRDFGAQIYGRLLKEAIRYDLGVLNGSPVGPATQPNLSFSDNAMLFGRLWLSPFSRTDYRSLQQLQFGIGFTHQDVRNQTGQQPMQDEARQRIVFQYAPAVTGDGAHDRFTPFMMWYWHRLSAMSVYTYAVERERNLANGAAAALHHQAWMVQGTFLLTDDDASFTTVRPKKPLDITRGQWGAWEVALRYAELLLDPQAFTLGMADVTKYAQTTKALSVGVNWYLTHNLKVQVHWEHNDFFGAGRAYAASSTANALLARVSLKF